MSLKNPVKYSVKTVHLFTWFSHAIHMVFHRVTPSSVEISTIWRPIGYKVGC